MKGREDSRKGEAASLTEAVRKNKSMAVHVKGSKVTLATDETTRCKPLYVSQSSSEILLHPQKVLTK